MGDRGGRPLRRRLEIRCRHPPGGARQGKGLRLWRAARNPLGVAAGRPGTHHEDVPTRDDVPGGEMLKHTPHHGGGDGTALPGGGPPPASPSPNGDIVLAAREPLVPRRGLDPRWAVAYTDSHVRTWRETVCELRPSSAGADGLGHACAWTRPQTAVSCYSGFADRLDPPASRASQTGPEEQAGDLSRGWGRSCCR